MTRPTCATILLAAALSVLGCSSDYEVAPAYDSGSLAPQSGQAPQPTTDSPGSPSEAPPESHPIAEASQPDPAEPPAMDQPTEPGSYASSPTPATLPASAPPTPLEPTGPRQPSIHLSAGVALPQSLPTGTAMGFSIDYQFTAGEPSPSSPYAWVIQPSKGQTVIQPVRLSHEGTLQGFVPQFRPENGPFSTHIEDANGNRLSRSLPLR